VSNSEDFKYWLEKGKEYLKLGYIEKAQEALKRSLELNPNQIDASIFLISIYSMIGKENDIFEILDKLMKNNPQFKSPADLMEYMMNLFGRESNINFKELLKTPSDEGSTIQQWIATGSYHLVKGDYDKAINILEKAVDKIYSPSNTEAALFTNLSAAYKMKGNLEKALWAGEKAIDLNPKLKTAWFNLSSIYFLNEQYNQSLDAINQTLELDGNFYKALELKKKIERKISEEPLESKEQSFYYQNRKVSKKEKEFLLNLEHVLGRKIPPLYNITRDGSLTQDFGFVVNNKHVVALGLDSTTITYIPESIKNLEYLEILSLQGCPNLSELPENLIFLRNLKVLKFYNNFTLNSVEKANSLINIVCNLNSLERLDIKYGLYSSLPKCLIHLKNLKEIDITNCNNLLNLSSKILEYFEVRELNRPLSRVLIRKKIPIKEESVKRDLDPNEIYNAYKKNSKTKKEAANSLISIIKNSKLIPQKIESIQILNTLGYQSDDLYKLLEKFLRYNKSLLIRKAAAESIIRNFPEKGISLIREIIFNETSIELKYIVKELLLSIDNNLKETLKIEINDWLVLIDIERIINKNIPNVESLEPKKEKYGTISYILGYIKKENNIIGLSLSPINYFSHLLNTLPESVGDLDSLVDLRLPNCDKLKNLPESIANLKKLKNLDCKGCKSLINLPENLKKLSNLRSIDLSKCIRLESLPPSLEGLTSLKNLNLDECKELKFLPKDIGNLHSLEILSLINCEKLISLPSSIGNLKSLRKLHLNSCRSIKMLPDEIGELLSISLLTLSKCSLLKSLPESVGSLELLEEIDLSYCYFLNTLPQSIGKLKSLKSLNLKACRQLQNLPNSITNLKSLQNLILDACFELKELPKDIGNLSSLTKLDISYCSGLEYLPNSLFRLNNLEELILSNKNLIENAPDSFKKIINLK